MSTITEVLRRLETGGRVGPAGEACARKQVAPGHRQGQADGRVARQAGSLLMDAVMWTVLLALAAAGVYGVYSMAFAGSKTSEATNELLALQSAVRQTYMRQVDFGAVGSDLVPLLVTTQSAPEKMATSTGTLVNAYSGTVDVTSNGRTFLVTFNGIPSEACVDLSTLSNSTAGVQSVSINGAAAVLSANMDVAAAAGQCLNAGSGGDGSTTSDGNAVTWEMTR